MIAEWNGMLPNSAKKQLKEIMESYHAFFHGDGINAPAVDALVPESDQLPSSVVDELADDASGPQPTSSSVMDESATDIIVSHLNQRHP